MSSSSQVIQPIMSCNTQRKEEVLRCVHDAAARRHMVNILNGYYGSRVVVLHKRVCSARVQRVHSPHQHNSGAAMCAWVSSRCVAGPGKPCVVRVSGWILHTNPTTCPSCAVCLLLLLRQSHNFVIGEYNVHLVRAQARIIIMSASLCIHARAKRPCMQRPLLLLRRNTPDRVCAGECVF